MCSNRGRSGPKQEKPSEFPKYHTCIIGGTTGTDFRLLNEGVITTNPGTVLWENSSEGSKQTPGLEHTFSSNPLFSTSGFLIPYDLILTKGGQTLFELNVSSELAETMEGIDGGI